MDALFAAGQLDAVPPAARKNFRLHPKVDRGRAGARVVGLRGAIVCIS